MIFEIRDSREEATKWRRRFALIPRFLENRNGRNTKIMWLEQYEERVIRNENGRCCFERRTKSASGIVEVLYE